LFARVKRAIPRRSRQLIRFYDYTELEAHHGFVKDFQIEYSKGSDHGPSVMAAKGQKVVEQLT